MGKMTKKEKVNYGDIKLHHLTLKYEISILQNNKEDAYIELGNDITGKKVYHFKKLGSQIRRQNETEWSGKIITIFKEDFAGFIPERTQYIIKFGKYKGKPLNEVIEDDIYWDWFLTLEDETEYNGKKSSKKETKEKILELRAISNTRVGVE